MRPDDIFPYPAFREGKLELAQSVNLACREGRTIVAEAMSGFGKTAAVLAGCISACEDEGLQIIYVCRTKRQVFRVLEELNRFSTRLPIRATSLFTKYDYCLLRQKSFGVSPETFKWYCKFQTTNNLCSYFLNVGFNRDKVEKLVESQTSRPAPITDLLSRGTELHVCPYEIARLAVLRSTIVVTTYHYLLDENSRGVLIPKDRPLDKIVGVIDEAHNIRDFISGSSTLELSFSDVEKCANDAKSLYLPQISSAILEIADRMRSFSASREGWLVDADSFIDALSGAHAKGWLSDLVFEISTASSVAWYSVSTGRNLPPSITRMASFLSALLSSPETRDLTLVKSDTSLFLTETRPSNRFKSAVKGLRSLVLLSATVNPVDLFLRSIGLDETTTMMHSATVGYKFRIRTVVDTSVTTKFKLRGHTMYSEIARRVASVVSSAPGSAGVFLPSYAMMEPIKGLLESELKARKCSRTMVVEQPNLANQDADRLMETFKAERGSILLAVQGGRFSEGEDFPGDGMDVSVVVGLSLPPPSPKLYAEFTQMEADGFGKQEAYMVLSLLPALRKAIQCAGRHVRSPGKVGMVFFMDSRFASQKIVDLMPSWLREDLVKGAFSPDSTASLTAQFFGGRAGD